MPLLFVVAAPLALVSVVAFSLARRERSRAEQARPSIDAAERVARGLSGRVEHDGGASRVWAELDGARIECTVARGARSLRLEVLVAQPLPSFDVTRHRIGGRELADYVGRVVLWASERGLEPISGPIDERLMRRLPSTLGGALDAIGATWMSVEAGRVVFVGLPAPPNDAAWPRAMARLERAIALCRELGEPRAT